MRKRKPVFCSAPEARRLDRRKPAAVAPSLGGGLAQHDRAASHVGAKYGGDWDKYCALVPWRIVPRVY